jgi:hypothetical protein
MSHIGAGGVALMSGTVALLARKGQRIHRLAGNAFFLSMCVMTLIGTGVAPFLPQRGSIIGGAVTFYLVTTAWLTVRRGEGEVALPEKLAAVFALMVAAAAFYFGFEAAHSPAGMLDGTPKQPYFIFGALAALSGILDIRAIRRGGLTGVPRMTRHLWRMCTAFVIAAISFFLGQQQVLPTALRGSSILFVPEIAILILMIFWLARVRLKTSVAAVLR